MWLGRDHAPFPRLKHRMSLQAWSKDRSRGLEGQVGVWGRDFGDRERWGWGPEVAQRNGEIGKGESEQPEAAGTGQALWG